MQNRYAGDVGDFGKLGLLRSLAKSGLNVGVNWYLVSANEDNGDGKHTGYLDDSQFIDCDDELLGKLGYMVYGNQRSIAMIESMNLIPRAVYFSEELQPPQTGGIDFRSQWHNNALKKLEGSDIVFLDPDNGLLVKSVSPGNPKSIKYIMEDEIVDYYSSGHSVVFYNHRCRLNEQAYLKRFRVFFGSEDLRSAAALGIKYVRGTTRDYFFLLHPEHLSQAKRAVASLLESSWNQHFKELKLDSIML
jgi:hypothetical protein